MNSDSNSLVSVIIPVYNGERYLAETIESVLNQTYRQIEVIVVDDGSTDKSVNIAQSYKEVRYIYQANQGVAVARNMGISEAHGEFIAFLDQDDLWTPNKLSLQVNYLLKNVNITYTLCKMRVFLEPGTDVPFWLKKDYLSQDIPGYIVGALLVRKSVFEAIGYFEPSYKYGNDTDWFSRTYDAGIPMMILPEVLLYKRIHSANESHKVQAITSELLQVIRSSINRKRNQKLSKNK